MTFLPPLATHAAVLPAGQTCIHCRVSNSREDSCIKFGEISTYRKRYAQG